MRVNKVTN